MSKHSSAPPWEYPPQPYNNLPCYTGQQHLSHRQLPLIHNQVVSHLEKKDSSLNGTNSHNYSSSIAHQPVVKPTALINCQANCNACCSHSNRVSHHWNPPSESARYLDHASLSKELPRYPHGVSNFPTEDARFMGDFSSTFDKLPFFPRDTVENLSNANVAGAVNKKDFASSVLHDNQHQNITVGSNLEPVKKEKCTKCRGVCRSNCKQSKQQSTLKLPNQDQLHVSRENVVRYSGHPSLNSTSWPLANQAQSGMWFQNAQPPFWMSHNDVQMSAGDSFGYWANNEDLTNISLHGRPGMQNTSRYPVHAGSQVGVSAPEVEQNKFKSMASYQDSLKHKCAELKPSGGSHGEILRKELQEPLQSHKVSKQRLHAGRSLDASREFSGRNCDLSAGSRVQDVSKPSVYEGSAESFTNGHSVGKLYGGANNSSNTRTGTTNFNSYPFVNVNNSYNMGLPQSLSQFSSHISYNQSKLDGGNNYVNNLQYSNATQVGPFISSQIDNNHTNSYISAATKATATNHHPVPNSCIQYSPSKKNSGDFSISQQSATHPVSDAIKYNFSNSGTEPAYSMLQSCNKMSENVACGKTMQMISGPGSCAEKVSSKVNPYYFSNLPHGANSNYPNVDRNVQMRPPFRFDSVDVRKETSCNVYCDNAPDSRNTSNFLYENPHLQQNSSNIDISPSAHVSDSSPVQVDSPFVTHSPVCVSRPIKKRRPRSKGVASNEQLHKSPILDVRQYLATWDEESDDVTMMQRLPEVLPNGNADGLVVLNNTGGMAADPGLGLVPMYNELADDCSESSSVHSENGQSCQQASIENLSGTVDIPKSSSVCVNHSETRLETLMTKDNNDVLDNGDVSEKVIDNIAERQISPHPRINAQSIDRNSSLSPCDRQKMVNLQTQAQKYSRPNLENDYLPPNESSISHAERCKIDYMNETKSPVALSSAQSFDTAAALLSEDDHETLSSCDLVSDMQMTESAPLTADDVSAMHDALPVVASRTEEGKLSHKENCKSSAEVNEAFAGNLKNSLNENQPGASGTCFKNGNNMLQTAASLESEVIKSESAPSKDTDKVFESVKQLDVLYCGQNESSRATDCNGPSDAARSCQVTTGESGLESGTSDILKQPENCREVFISTDIQFPDLSYSNSDSSVDGDMRASKGVFSEDVACSPQSAHDIYCEKQDPSFIRSFVNEIASKIPNFDCHVTSDLQESSCIDSQVSSNQKTDEKNPEALLSSECNMLVPPGVGVLLQFSKSGNCDEVAEKKKLPGHISSETFTKFQKCNTVITNANCQLSSYNGGSASNSHIMEVKQNNKVSMQYKKILRLKSLLAVNITHDVINSHFAKRKIELRTREAKKCSYKKSALKTVNFKYSVKERKIFRRRILNKRKLLSSATSGKNNCSSDFSQSNTGKNELTKIVAKWEKLGSDDSAVEHLTENVLAVGDKISGDDLRLEAESNKCEETEIAINLVLDAAKQENSSDLSSKCLQKHVPESSTSDFSLNEQNICRASRQTHESDILVLQNSASFVGDENCEPCVGGRKPEEEAVDLSVSKHDINTSGDMNINCPQEANKGAVFCSRGSGPEVTIHRKNAIFNFSELNITSGNVPSNKESEFHTCLESSHFKPDAQINDVHAQWQDCEMWNQNVSSFQKPVEKLFVTDSGLVGSSEPHLTAEHIRSNMPIQEEALDLCKHNCKERLDKCENSETVWNACIEVSQHLKQQKPQFHTDLCSPLTEENKKNSETGGLNHKPVPLDLEKKCNVIVVHDPKNGGIGDSSESKDVNKTSEVSNTTLSFDDDHCAKEIFSTVDCTYSSSENKPIVYNASTNQTSVSFNQPKSPLYIERTEKYTSDDCKESETTATAVCPGSEQSTLTSVCLYGTNTTVLKDVQYLDGVPENQESNLKSAMHTTFSCHKSTESWAVNSMPKFKALQQFRRDNVKDKDINEIQDLDYNSKITSVHSSEGANKSEFVDDRKHATDVAEHSFNNQGQDMDEVHQKVNVYKTEIPSTRSGKDCKQQRAIDDTLHSESLEVKRENVRDIQQSDSDSETKATSSAVEDSKKLDSADGKVCKRELLISESIQRQEDERQIMDNSQKNEKEFVLMDGSECKVEKYTFENFQDQLTLSCTSPDYQLPSLGENHIDTELNPQGKSCNIETACSSDHSEQTESCRDFRVLEISRPDNVYAQGLGQQYSDNGCEGGSVTHRNCKQLVVQDTSCYRVEICTSPSRPIQNQDGSVLKNQKSSHEMGLQSSSSNQIYELPCSPNYNVYKTEVSVPENNDVQTEELPCSQNYKLYKTEVLVSEKIENKDVQTEEISHKSELEISVHSKDSQKQKFETINICELVNSADKKCLVKSDELQQPYNNYKMNTTSIDHNIIQSESMGNISSNEECKHDDVQDKDCIVKLLSHEHCHKSEFITSVSTQDYKSSGLVCSDLSNTHNCEPEDVQDGVELQIAVKNENEKLVVPDGNDAEPSKPAGQHLYKHVLCTEVNLQNEDMQVQKERCSEESETAYADNHACKQLEVAEVDGGETQKPDLIIRGVVSRSVCDDEQPLSAGDGLGNTETSSLLKVDSTVVELSSDNAFKLVKFTPVNISDSSMVEPEHNLATQETCMPQTCENQNNCGLPEDSFHDEASCRTNTVLKYFGITVDNKIVNDTTESTTCFSNVKELVGGASTTVVSDQSLQHCKGNNIVMENISISVTSLDLIINDGASIGKVMESIEKVIEPNCGNSYLDTRKTEYREFHGETVQEQEVIFENIDSSSERNYITSAPEDRRCMIESEMVFDPKSTDAIDINTESTEQNEVSVQAEKKLTEVVPDVDDLKSSAFVPGLVHLSCKNNGNFNKQEDSIPISGLENTSDLGPYTQNGTSENEAFDRREFVNVGSVETNMVELLSASDQKGVLGYTSNNNQNNHLVEDKNMKMQETANNKVSSNKIFEKECNDILENATVSIIQKTPLSEIVHNKSVQNNDAEPVKEKQSTGHPRSMSVEMSINTFDDVELLESRKEEISVISVTQPYSELIQAGILCSENEQEQNGNIFTSENHTELECEKKARAIFTKVCFIDDDHKDHPHQECTGETKVDVSSEAASAEHSTASSLKEQNYDGINNQRSINMTTEHDVQMELQNLSCVEGQAINDISVDPTVWKCAEEISHKCEQPKPPNKEPVDKTNVIYSCEEDSEKWEQVNFVSSTHGKCIDRSEDDPSVHASLLSNGELIEGQFIIIQNNCSDDITDTINISAKRVALNSVCLEDLEHVNEESGTWPVIVESSEATQIFIAVAEGTADEVSESEMPCLEVEPECLKSPEMPHLEVMIKQDENDSNDQDLEMPVLDVSTSVTTEQNEEAVKIPELESIISPGTEVTTCVHTAVSGCCHSHVSAEETEAIYSQQIKPSQNYVVSNIIGSMPSTHDVSILQMDSSRTSLNENVLSSVEVGNIFPVLASENVEPSFQDATHIIPGDSVSNWPYLEEEVPSELLIPDPEATVPLLEAPIDTVVPSFSSKSFSPNSSLGEWCRKRNVVKNKFRTKGWTKKRIFYYYNSDTHKTLIRKKGNLNWNRIFARSKVDRSKYFKINRSKRSKISQGWQYFRSSPAKWQQKKTGRNYSNTGNVIAEGDNHSKIEVHLTQKCPQLGGTKTWCVVGSSEVNNDHSWPVIEENNNVMTASSDDSKSEDKVPIVLVKRLVLKKSNSSSDGEGLQEYIVKSQNAEDIFPAYKEKSLVEANDIDITVYQDKTTETLSSDDYVTAKECSVDVGCSKSISCQVELTPLTCSVCDSNISTVSSPGYCKRHSPKHLTDCSEHVSVDEHQASNNAHHIPRVIIKRTGPGSAKYQSFLLSSPGGSQWQPVVQLLRSKVLDNLARNVLEVGSIKKVISLSNFRLVLRKRSNAASESVVESDDKQTQAVLEPSQSLNEELCGGEFFSMVHEEEEKTVKNASSCKYVVLENNTKDTCLTFQRQRSDSETEQPEQTDKQCSNEDLSFPWVTTYKGKEVLSCTEISDSEQPTNRNRDRKCKAVCTYMESSSEDSQDNREQLLCPVVRINRKRLSENYDKTQSFSEVCNKKSLICAETEASSVDANVLVTSGKRKHSFSENSESCRKKANISRHNRSSSVEDLCSFGCSIVGIEDGARFGFRERGVHRPRSLRCKNVAAVSEEERRPDVCSVCNYVFVDEADKADHVKQHPYHCQRCHLAFQSKVMEGLDVVGGRLVVGYHWERGQSNPRVRQMDVDSRPGTQLLVAVEPV
ncbi:hypothetical protein PR048_009690 [Dryococelus australis]|uniref:C2H2-type domain-containing protein n=1 Tax=Dryococelus australis TaxID=614101 RepID=A0ABQ9I2F3_9NEOP|nr:hypothetical protein PR048_009690 [Dryococelus australis]